MTRSISIVTVWPAPNVNMVCLTHVQEPSGFRRNDLHRSEVMTFRAEAESFVPLAFVPAVNLGRRCRCLHGREHLDYAIAVLGACRNEPGIARFKSDCLSLNRQLRSARYDIAHRLVIASDCTLGLRLFVTP